MRETLYFGRRREKGDWRSMKGERCEPRYLKLKLVVAVVGGGTREHMYIVLQTVEIRAVTAGTVALHPSVFRFTQSDKKQVGARLPGQPQRFYPQLFNGYFVVIMATFSNQQHVLCTSDRWLFQFLCFQLLLSHQWVWMYCVFYNIVMKLKMFRLCP